MSYPNARICVTPNCRRVATTTVAGIGEWCQTCFAMHFPAPSIYQTQLPNNLHANLPPSIYHPYANLNANVYPNMNAPLPPPIQIPRLPPRPALNGNINAPLPNQFVPMPPIQHFFRPVTERREILRREEERRKQIEQDRLNTEKLLDVTQNSIPPPSSILQSEQPVPRPSMILRSSSTS